MENKNILISGASIAGPALAFWLHRYGFNVTVVERAPGIRPGGYAVDFRGTAMQVLERMDIVDEIKKHETRAGKITIVDENNKKLTSMPDGFTSGELEILRGDLANVLYDASKQYTEYVFDDSISKINQVADGVEVSFNDGKTRKFDLVIGADGLHSNVRSLAFGKESEYMHHLGIYFAIFTLPNFMELKDMAGLYYGTLGKRVGLFSARHDTAASGSFYFTSPAFQYNYRDIAGQKQFIRERFETEKWQVPALLKYMDEANDFYFDSISQIRMDRWSIGRVALLGDAGFCASPMAGMGTSMAVVGAYILATELKRANGDHITAFAKYEARMRPFVTNAQKMAEGADWFVPKTRLKQWLSLQIWKILPHTPWKNMMIEMPLKVANTVVLEDYD
ncbi:FAD-dependent monooxygenase [Mucilaginibacter sp. X4EP1]|uniref:FAD-dependent monooxygenase n=1 Tax=Mucilaginibacter sp. X4EP1 TaxID=2723092 RepID=UPI00216A4E2D|nr:FAD-dependent monooxygenase [Mucilaginibacter sp. X4EP1]MCS3811620.1 2-polyprenyl-6-methoxyphenol hydroxylase-like FAD-dependent oxidoreductase [Mucilaginibacter sp. X4EP1]